MTMFVGFVNKYPNRLVAVHICDEQGPACGTYVDLNCWQPRHGGPEDLTCRRCIKIAAKRAAAKEDTQ